MQKPFAGKLVAAVCNHFVYIHVALGSAARLPHRKREVLRKRAAYHLVCRLTDVAAFFLRHPLRDKLKVCPRRSKLEYTESVYYLFRHFFYSYFKVFKA